MFTAKCNGRVLFDLKSQIVLTNPKLCMEENAAGSLEFDIDPEHPLYDSIEPMVSEITVYQDGNEIWSGRPTEIKDNFFGMRSVYCEGELSYLCDTIQPPSESHITGNTNVRQWLSERLAVHNAKAPANRRFEVGAVTVIKSGTLYRYTNYENTLECINEKLVKSLGGHLRVRKENGKRYLDYYQEYPGTASQVIRFGLNLLDHSKTLTRTDIATVCLPLGAKQDKKDFEALEKYLDVSSVNGGSIYVENSSGVSSFGRIIKVVHWDDVTTASALLAKAREWINDAQYDELQLEVNALDFHLVDEDTPAIRLLDEVRVVSEPHGLDRWFPVTKMEIPLDNPAGTVLALGTSKKESLTSKATRLDVSVDSVNQSLDSLPSTILKQAQDNVSQLIRTGAFGGHVVVLPDEIYITDSASLSSAKKVWRWNLNGLGYSTTGINGDFGTAITMDGEIVANYITVGTMAADRIHGGTLTLGGINNVNGVFEMRDASNTTTGEWNKDGLTQTTIEKGWGGPAGISVVDIPLKMHQNEAMIRWLQEGKYAGYIGIQGWPYGKKRSNLTSGERHLSLLGGTRLAIGLTSNKSGTDIDSKGNFAGYPGVISIGYSSSGEYTGSEPITTISTHMHLINQHSIMCSGGGFFNSGYTKNSGAGFYFEQTYSEIPHIRGAEIHLDTFSSGSYGYGDKKVYYNTREVATVSSSSVRYKHDIKPIEENDLDPHRLLDLPVVQFRWNDDHELQYEDMRDIAVPGIIAEDVADIYPAAVIRNGDTVESWDERRLIPGMLALIQEHEKRIAELERKHA